MWDIDEKLVNYSNFSLWGQWVANTQSSSLGLYQIHNFDDKTRETEININIINLIASLIIVRHGYS